MTRCVEPISCQIYHHYRSWPKIDPLAATSHVFVGRVFPLYLSRYPSLVGAPEVEDLNQVVRSGCQATGLVTKLLIEAGVGRNESSSSQSHGDPRSAKCGN